MKKFRLLQLCSAAAFLAFGLSLAPAVQAQDQDRDRQAQDRDHDDSWYQNRDSFYHGEHWKARMFERVREDLDRVQASTFPVSSDEYRLVKTKRQLNELQDKLAAGRYDQPELDEVIGSLDRVVASNKLSPRDRDMLSDDLSRLRQYREHHNDWR